MKSFQALAKINESTALPGELITDSGIENRLKLWSPEPFEVELFKDGASQSLFGQTACGNYFSLFGVKNLSSTPSFILSPGGPSAFRIELIFDHAIIGKKLLLPSDSAVVAAGFTFAGIDTVFLNPGLSGVITEPDKELLECLSRSASSMGGVKWSGKIGQSAKLCLNREETDDEEAKVQRRIQAKGSH